MFEKYTQGLNLAVKQSLEFQKIWFEKMQQLKMSSKQTNKRLVIRIVDK